MGRSANIAAACIAFVAIMYLFVLPAVNPPLSTGAQWLSAHAPLPSSSTTTVVHIQQAHLRLAAHPTSDAPLDILELDSVLRC